MSRTPQKAKGVKKKRTTKSKTAKGVTTAKKAKPKSQQTRAQQPPPPIPPAQAAAAAGAPRKRRVAPPFAVSCSQEAGAVVQKMSAPEIKEWRRKTYWRVQLAEGALTGHFVALCGVNVANTSPWSEFIVAGEKFCIERRPGPGHMREYVVMLADAPTPGDGPSKHDGSDQGGDGSSGSPKSGKKRGNDSPGSTALDRFISVALQLEIEKALVWRVTRRELHRSCNQLKDKLQTHCDSISRRADLVSDQLSSHVSGAITSLQRSLRRFAFTPERSKASLNLVREVPVQQSSYQASLQPRLHGQNTGLSFVLFGWSGEGHPPVLPADWASYLFGMLPEQERAYS